MTEREMEKLVIVGGRHAGNLVPIAAGVKFVHVPVFANEVRRYRGEHESMDKATLEIHIYRRFPIRRHDRDDFVLVPSEYDEKQAVLACKIWFQEPIQSPMLDILNDRSVLHVTYNSNGGFTLWEACDKYYHADLTAEQLRELGEQLIAIANEKAGPKP